jgi:hypothetical protein
VEGRDIHKLTTSYVSEIKWREGNREQHMSYYKRVELLDMEPSDLLDAV